MACGLFRNFFLPIFLFVSGFGICLLYGKYSYMPIDHAVAFDGGWRILQGQLPLLDFNTPDSFCLIFLQALFFKIFGVTWFAYALNAATFNGLYAVLSYVFFRELSLSRWWSAFYAVLSAGTLFAIEGLPIRDPYVFFYIFIIALLVTSAVKRPTERFSSSLKTGLIPVFVLVAYFDKPNPTVFILPAILVFLIYSFVNTGRRYQVSAFLSASGLIVLAGLVIAIIFRDFPFAKLGEVIGKHLSLGSGRFLALIDPAVTVNALVKILFAWKLTGIFIIVATLLLHLISRIKQRETKILWVILFVLLAFLSLAVIAPDLQIKNDQIPYYWYIVHAGDGFITFFKCYLILLVLILYASLFHRLHISFEKSCGLELVLLLCFVSVCVLTALTTNNTPIKSAPFIVPALGILHKILGHASVAISDKSFQFTAYPRVLGFIIGAIALLDAGFTTYRSHQLQHAILFDAENQVSISGIPAFSFPVLPKKPIASILYPYGGEDIARLTSFFTHHEGNFFILGDSAHFYGILKRPSVPHSLWYHPGYTIPHMEEPGILNFQKEIIERLKKYNVRYVILESAIDFNLLIRTRGNAPTPDRLQANTVFGIRLERLPLLNQFVNSAKCGETSLGSFKVLELCSKAK